MMSLTRSIPLLLGAAHLLLALPAAANPPALAPLAFLPGDDASAPAAGKQLNPRIARGDGSALLVWVDERPALTELPTFSGGPAFDHHIGSSWDIYAARLDASGALMDATPIIVTRAVQNQGMPEVAWNGTSWLVAYSGQSGLQCCPEVGRYAVRIAADGTVLDPAPLTLATGSFADAAWPAALGSDGTNWLLVWTVNGNQVTGMRIAPDGTVLDPAGVALYTGGSPGDFDIAFANGQYMVVWSSGGRTSGGAILARRFTPALVPAGAATTVNTYAPSVGRNCRVATDGTGYFVAWWEDRYYGWSQLVGGRVSGSGVALDPAGLPLTEAYGYTNYEPDVSWDGVNYVTVYDRSAFPPIDLFATRVTPAGVVLDYDTSAIAVSTAPESQFEAAAARVPGGDGTLVVWRDARYPGTGYGDLFGTVLAPDGGLGAERCVAVGAPRQTLLKLVPNGAGHLAVYRSETGIGSRILAQRVSAAGAALDPEPVEVAAGGAEITQPSAAWNGSQYLIAWENSATDRISARRYSPALVALDPAPLAVMPGNHPDVAAVNDIFLVTGSYENPHEIQKIYAMRVRGSDGALLDPSPVLVGGSHARYPRVAAFDDRWLIVWERHPTHDNPNATAKGSILLASGVPQAEFSIQTDGKFPQLAVGAGAALVAWQVRNGPTVEDLDIQARRLLPTGAFADPAPYFVSTAVNAQFDVAVAWSGTEYVTAFGDFRNDDIYASKPGDLYGARVSASGAVLDPAGFPFSDEAIPEMRAAAAGANGEFLLGGSVFRPESGYVNYRIGLRSTAVASGVPVLATGAGLRLDAAPNPFARGTRVAFDLAEPAAVRLRVHDAAGRLVGTLAERALGAGPHAVSWDGRGRDGEPVPAGVYFLSLEAGGARETKRLVLVR